MTYSLDFRRKVMSIKEREGLGREEAARRFGIGVATLDRWAKRLGISRKKKPVAPEGRRGGEAGVPGADGGA